uniref:Mediator of RNA polymerase II transcription subunit 7 n=1 Tax=Loa loa TaxID=7209 RepID=A0A1I7V6B1_LOALO
MRYFADSDYVIAEIMDPMQIVGKTIQDVRTLTDAIRTKMFDAFAKINNGAAEEFRNRQEQISEIKKICQGLESTRKIIGISHYFRYPM